MNNQLSASQNTSLSHNNKSRTAIIVVLALLLIAGVVVIYLQRPDPSMTKPASISSIGQKEFKITIDNGKRVKGPAVITVKKGDKIHIQYAATDMGEADVRLEAFALNAGLVGNAVSDMEFIADKAGTFPIELRVEGEESHATSKTSSHEDQAPWTPISSVVIK